MLSPLSSPVGRPRFSSCHVTRRTRRTEGCGRGCVSSANCCGTGSESKLCARGKSGEECTKSGEWSLLPFSVFTYYRTSGRRRGDEFRHVRRKLGREEGRTGRHRSPEIGKAITRSDGMCAWLKNQKSESPVFTHKRVTPGLTSI